MQVYLQPLSGLANRLRAIASMLLLFPKHEIKCYWGEDSSLGTKPPFSHPRLLTITKEEFASVESKIWPTKKGLTITSDLIALSAGSLGEQVYIPKLIRSIDQFQPRLLLLSAGGEFGIGLRARRAKMRARVYGELTWDPKIISHLQNRQLFDYIGLHIRAKDLSSYLPSEKKMISSLRDLAAKLGVSEVYLAADSFEEKKNWLKILQDHGLFANQQETKNLDRKSPNDLVASCVDFIHLSRAKAMVYSSASSFGHEAAIQNARSEMSLGLPPQKSRLRYYLNNTAVAHTARYLAGRRVHRL